MMSVYLGCMTIVLKFPFTRAASTNGLQRYSGFVVAGAGTVVLGLVGNDSVEFDGNVADVGVVDRLGGRGARAIDRLEGIASGSFEYCMRNNLPNRVEKRHNVKLPRGYDQTAPEFLCDCAKLPAVGL